MKKLILALLLFPFISNAQTRNGVVEIPGKSAEQLYLKANEWFALTFKSAKDIIQLNDPTEKKIIGKGSKKHSYTIDSNHVYLFINFTLIVQFRDGRYKYELIPTGFSSGKDEMSYEEGMALSTEEGMTTYFNAMGITSKLFGKEKFQSMVDSQRGAFVDSDKQLQQLVDDLTAFLKSEDKNTDW